MIAAIAPAGTNERVASVQFSSGGDVLVFNIDQNITNSGIVENEAASKVKIVYKDDSFDLSYPVEYTSVNVYNISGQLVDSYNLPNDGVFSIPAGDLAKGIYLLKFSGRSVGETVKAVK